MTTPMTTRLPIPKRSHDLPYSNGRVKLSSLCPSCGYTHGLIIIRFREDKGFIRCGQCDVALHSVEQAGEVLA